MKYTDIPKIAALWDEPSAGDFFRMTPEEQQRYYRSTQQPKNIYRNKWRQLGTQQQLQNFQREQEIRKNWNNWQNARAAEDARIRYRDSYQYQTKPRLIRITSKVPPARIRYADAIADWKRRDAEFEAARKSGTYQGKGYGSIGTGPNAISFGTKKSVNLSGTMRGPGVTAIKPRPTQQGYRDVKGAWHAIA